MMVKEARNLTAVRSNGFSDPFCKGYVNLYSSKRLKILLSSRFILHLHFFKERETNDLLL